MFPDLKTIVDYGVYTVKDLQLYNKGLLKRRNVSRNRTCEACHYVCRETSVSCDNCLGLVSMMSPKADSKSL